MYQQPKYQSYSSSVTQSYLPTHPTEGVVKDFIIGLRFSKEDDSAILGNVNSDQT